jgi:hypothetical protein
LQLICPKATTVSIARFKHALCHHVKSFPQDNSFGEKKKSTGLRKRDIRTRRMKKICLLKEKS